MAKSKALEKVLGKTSTPAQRAFGGGRRIGKNIGRKQGAAAGLGAGLTVAAIREMTNRNKLEKLKEENISAAQKAAIEETLRKLAQEEGTTSKVNQSPRPKARPEGMAKGGYANCGASMKATQKATMMCGGMVHKKK